MKNTSSKFGTGIKFQNHKGTKHEKNKSARSRINLNVREHERNNLLSIERCLWDTDNFTQEQLQCKASKRERDKRIALQKSTRNLAGSERV